MENMLQGSAFITGAGSGIGQCTALAFAKNGVRQLALCDIQAAALENTSAELKSLYPEIELLLIEMDTSDESAVGSAVTQTVAAFGRIDIAFNNAGIGGPRTQTHETSLDEWQRVMDVNLKGVWLCHRAQIRQMLTQEPRDPGVRGSRGVIVNMASVLGVVASPRETPACPYAASKHAVVGFSKNDGCLYAPQKVRINAICPGYVATPLLRGYIVRHYRLVGNRPLLICSYRTRNMPVQMSCVK
ncbi:related to dehydrogenase [Ramularia collo-cygni]|uniref:Related to dehydrogenase n=1 Tax=Ramularia collo-cygni TaxID=112498 RepID=A0A2D3UU62_9PEZI|nr:related to dehydrogenase [Ramularia collo-cygni]CZT16440.1 related to dehydrogenase [Ramularia collo-cygni]